MHTHSRFNYPKMSNSTPGGVALTFLFALLFGAVVFFMTLLGQPH
ncbi:MAG TPA: hypothetical protein VFB04_04525 [Terriglobales bacterium]|nr:hypothetical protein [Terriglobales bacterium]